MEFFTKNLIPTSTRKEREQAYNSLRWEKLDTLYEHKAYYQRILGNFGMVGAYPECIELLIKCHEGYLGQRDLDYWLRVGFARPEGLVEKLKSCLV